MGLARAANAYLDGQAPWKSIKEDRQAAATSVYVILRVIDNLKVLLAPFLPFTAQRLHEYLGYDDQLFGRLYIEEFTETSQTHRALCYDDSQAAGKWQPSQLPPGQALRQPAPLFKKLDEAVVEEELSRLGVAQSS